LFLFLALLAATVARFVAARGNATAEPVLLLAITVGIAFLGFSMFVATAALLVVAAYHVRGGLRRRG
jgi:uncharacterized membrane protein YvlD (DUF360 family)